MENQIPPVFPFFQSVENQRTVRLNHQTVLMGGIGLEYHPPVGASDLIKKNSREKTGAFVDGIEPVPNHFLPHLLSK